MSVPGILVCSSFLISVCMFIVSKALFTSSAIVIVRAGGGVNWLNPFATVLFNVCSAVTVECCVLYPCCVGGLVYLLLCKEESSCCCCLPTPMTLARGEYDIPACGPPASFFVHLDCSTATPAGSVHKSRGDNVVRTWVQLKR